jgi:riboflavin transporter FmnP
MVTAVAIFAALAIALHISPLKMPAPYAPFLIYELWEIPIVAAFLLYGTRLGLSVAVINFLSLMVIFPGSLEAGPIYNLIAIASMLLGMIFAFKLAGFSSKLKSGLRAFWLALVFGITARVVVMAVVNLALLQFSPPLGFNMPFEAVVAILPLLILFNSTVAIYTIVIARMVTTTVSSATRIPARYGR